MKLELRKVDALDVHSGYWVYFDGKCVGATDAENAEKVSDYVIVNQMAAEQGEHGADDWKRAFELECLP